jgi:hypothetical protein
MSVNIRLAKLSDWPNIQAFHLEQNRLQGTSYALPQLFKADGSGDFAPNIALAFMVERDGHPVQAFFFELVPEACFAGCDPQATAYARREIDRIAFLLRGMGFSGINCKVPEHMVEHIAPPLEKAGFEPSVMVNFFKDLRLPDLIREDADHE